MAIPTCSHPRRVCSPTTSFASATSVVGRLYCKSLFPLGIKNSPGCRRDFHVKMWGTSSPDDKLTGDLGNAFEVAEIGGRWSDRLLAGKLSSGDFGLLQQYRGQSGHQPAMADNRRFYEYTP